MGKSRTQACSLIAAGLVSVNRVPVTQPAKQIAPGDQIVIRGFGKCYLGTQIRTTRKDRLFITIQKQMCIRDSLYYRYGQPEYDGL